MINWLDAPHSISALRQVLAPRWRCGYEHGTPCRIYLHTRAGRDLSITVMADRKSEALVLAHQILSAIGGVKEIADG